jgi:hypothetical protein
MCVCRVSLWIRWRQQISPKLRWISALLHGVTSQTVVLFFPMAQQPLLGQDLLIIEASRSHSDTPHSVRIFWTSDQLDAETPPYLTTHNTHKRQISVPPGGFRTRNPNKRNAADPRLRPRGHWDRQTAVLYLTKYMVWQGGTAQP